MRITFICSPPNMSGGMRVVAIYAQHLQRRGHDVTIVFPPRIQPAFRSKAMSLLKGRGWPNLSPLGQSHFTNIDVKQHMLDSPRPVIDGDVPDGDIVIATFWRTAEWVASLSSAKGAKVLFLQGYEVYSEKTAERIKRTWLLPMHKIVISEWLSDLARQQFNDNDVSLVPNSVDTGLFDAEPRGKQAVPTIGFMHSRHASKGCDIAHEAIHIAREDLRRLKVVAFGSMAPDAQGPLPDNTEFALNPPQNMLRNIYAKCDAWLFASRSEGFGLPILEAMACRTPVIGTPTGAAPDLLSRGCGILVKPEDPEDMARAIVHVHDLPQERWKEMSNSPYRKARGYTWDNATNLFEEALLHAIEHY